VLLCGTHHRHVHRTGWEILIHPRHVEFIPRAIIEPTRTHSAADLIRWTISVATSRNLTYRARMPMNAIHRRLCRSDYWTNIVRSQLLPWALRGVPLDGEVLEIGPGYGVTTRWLAQRSERLTAVEIDPALATALRAELAGRVEVHHGDGSALPFADASFDAVVCFTMLHHVPSAHLQDRLFAEACRVLRPGGVFAGSDSRLSLRFRLLHLRDTMVVVDPDNLPDRLGLAGLTDPRVELGSRSLRFTAIRPR
jgi:SAM-dependent methyltransferase